MKALTLTQPWASLVAIGAKQIETRSWATKYRGPLAIHAGQGLGPAGGNDGFIRLCTGSEYIYAALEAAGLVPFTWNIEALLALPRGAIIATCELVACGQIRADGIYDLGHNKGAKLADLPAEPELSFGDYTPFRVAWFLSNIKRLPEPVPAKGAMSLWECKL